MVGILGSCCVVFDDASEDDVLKLHGERKDARLEHERGDVGAMVSWSTQKRGRPCSTLAAVEEKQLELGGCRCSDCWFMKKSGWCRDLCRNWSVGDLRLLWRE